MGRPQPPLGDTTDQERTSCLRQSLPSFVLIGKCQQPKSEGRLASLQYLEKLGAGGSAWRFLRARPPATCCLGQPVVEVRAFPA